MDDDIKKKKIRAGIIYAVIVLVLMFLINRFMNSQRTCCTVNSNKWLQKEKFPLWKSM